MPKEPESTTWPSLFEGLFSALAAIVPSATKTSSSTANRKRFQPIISGCPIPKACSLRRQPESRFCQPSPRGNLLSCKRYGGLRTIGEIGSHLETEGVP